MRRAVSPCCRVIALSFKANELGFEFANQRLPGEFGEVGAAVRVAAHLRLLIGDGRWAACFEVVQHVPRGLHAHASASNSLGVGAGPERLGFAPNNPASHIKRIFPEPGQVEPTRPSVDGPRSTAMRTDMPAAMRADPPEVDVDFVLHGEGLRRRGPRNQLRGRCKFRNHAVAARASEIRHF